MAGGTTEHFHIGGPREMPQQAAGAMDPDGQDPRSALSAGARLVAVPGASRGPARMALSKRRLNKMFPVFPVLFPACSQSGPMDSGVVPSVLDCLPRFLWALCRRYPYISTTRNTGNIGNRIETSRVGLGSHVEQTRNTGNRPGEGGFLRKIPARVTSFEISFPNWTSRVRVASPAPNLPRISSLHDRCFSPEFL
jgi:hypothetical protein